MYDFDEHDRNKKEKVIPETALSLFIDNLLNLVDNKVYPINQKSEELGKTTKFYKNERIG